MLPALPGIAYFIWALARKGVGATGPRQKLNGVDSTTASSSPSVAAAAALDRLAVLARTADPFTPPMAVPTVARRVQPRAVETPPELATTGSRRTKWSEALADIAIAIVAGMRSQTDRHEARAPIWHARQFILTPPEGPEWNDRGMVTPAQMSAQGIPAASGCNTIMSSPKCDARMSPDGTSHDEQQGGPAAGSGAGRTRREAHQCRSRPGAGAQRPSVPPSAGRPPAGRGSGPAPREPRAPGPQPAVHGGSRAPRAPDQRPLPGTQRQPHGRKAARAREPRSAAAGAAFSMGRRPWVGAVPSGRRSSAAATTGSPARAPRAGPSRPRGAGI